MNEAPTPSQALTGKFRIVGIQPGTVYTTSHGYVDLRTVDLATAEQLHARGFAYLAKVEVAPVEAEAAEPSTQEASPAPEAPAAPKRKRSTPAA